jgi:hypothetical protein
VFAAPPWPFGQTLARGSRRHKATHRPDARRGGHAPRSLRAPLPPAHPQKLRAHSGTLAAHAAGALVALIADGGSAAQQRFVECGGVEAVCAVGGAGVSGVCLCWNAGRTLEPAEQRDGVMCKHGFPRSRGRRRARRCRPPCTQALADRPRNDAGRSTLRLRLVLAEVSRASKAWEARVHQAAADAASPAAAGVPSLPLAALAAAAVG